MHKFCASWIDWLKQCCQNIFTLLLFYFVGQIGRWEKQSFKKRHSRWRISKYISRNRLPWADMRNVKQTSVSEVWAKLQIQSNIVIKVFHMQYCWLSNQNNEDSIMIWVKILPQHKFLLFELLSLMHLRIQGTLRKSTIGKIQ